MKRKNRNYFLRPVIFILMSMESAKGSLSPEQVLEVEGKYDFSLRLIDSRVQNSKEVTVSF